MFTPTPPEVYGGSDGHSAARKCQKMTTSSLSFKKTGVRCGPSVSAETGWLAGWLLRGQKCRVAVPQLSGFTASQ